MIMTPFDGRRQMAAKLVFYDPVADPEVKGARPLRPVETLRAGRMGLVWGGHGSTARFWPAFEDAVQSIYEPVALHKIYKHSTWNPAPMTDMDELASKIDYAIAGVGA